MLNVFSYSLDALLSVSPPPPSPLLLMTTTTTTITFSSFLLTPFGNRDRIEGSLYLSLLPPPTDWPSRRNVGRLSVTRDEGHLAKELIKAKRKKRRDGDDNSTTPFIDNSIFNLIKFRNLIRDQRRVQGIYFSFVMHRYRS